MRVHEGHQRVRHNLVTKQQVSYSEISRRRMGHEKQGPDSWATVPDITLNLGHSILTS